MGVSISTQYKKTPEDVGDLWYFLAALADKLARESQEGVYEIGAPGYGDHSITIAPTTPASGQGTMGMGSRAGSQVFALPRGYS